MSYLKRLSPATYGEIGVVLVVWIVVLSQLHPNLLLTNSTTTGGDTGAHFILPAYLRDHLLAHGHLTGWFPSWYNGFPLYSYYFVLPDLFAALASVVIPYGIAFKAITILGSLLLPVAAIVLGRGFRLRAPLPAALGAASLPFLFDSTFTIDGGNLFSTLAGEYSFSLGLSLVLIAAGLFARRIERGRGIVGVAVAMSVAMAAHLLPWMWILTVMFGLLAIAVTPLRHYFHDEVLGSRRGVGVALPLARPRRVLSFVARAAGLSALLSAWWLLPFVSLQQYANPMGYNNVTTYQTLLYPKADYWVIWLAGFAVALGLIRRSRFVAVLAFSTALAGLAVRFEPQGSIYNARLLPFWFIGLYLLAAWLLGMALSALARYFARHWSHVAIRDFGPGAFGAALAAGLLSAVVVAAPFVLPARFLPVTPGANQVSSWAAWNYSGMESKSGYAEYHALVSQLELVTRQHGCGRAMWEYSSSMDRFGTPMALMLLPYWTQGCVASMEGLFFESSATTPYHFINQAELSPSPSNPQVGLNYPSLDVAMGVRHLQLLGVRYYLANSASTISQARKIPDLQLVGSSKVPGAHRWNIYRVRHSALVTGLRHLPRVLSKAATSSASWLQLSQAWYLHPHRWAYPLAASGPAHWPKGPSSPQPTLPAVRVSKIQRTDASISFSVDRLGIPVLVKESYFPAWQASGADGPYRVSPNLMVLIPRSHRVSLVYGSSPSQALGAGLSEIAIAGLLIWGLFGLAKRRKA